MRKLCQDGIADRDTRMLGMHFTKSHPWMINDFFVNF